MAKAKSSLLDDVRASLPKGRGFAPWYETLADDLRDDVQAIKSQWLRGELVSTKTALSYSLSRALKARGIDIGHAGVIRWLEKV